MTDVVKWMTTATSGQGVSLLLATAVGYANGSMTWQVALAGAVGALALVAFPENQQLSGAVQTATLDVEKVVDAYRLGLGHGQSLPQVALPSLPQVPAPGSFNAYAPAPTAAPAPAVTPIPVLAVGHGATL